MSFARIVAASALVGALAGPASASNILVNGGFETGNFAGWEVTDFANPLYPASVVGAGFTVGNYGFFASAPTEGTRAMVDGFEGAGPGHIRFSQVVTLTGPMALTFDYRVAWDMLSDATAARLFDVRVEDLAGGVLLETNLLTALPGTRNPDTGNLHAWVDLGAFAGLTVRVALDQYIPEPFAGPGLMQIDDVVIDTAVPEPGALALAATGLAAALAARARRRPTAP